MYDAQELTVEQIGKVLGVSRTSIYRALAKDQLTAPKPALPGGRRACDGHRSGWVNCRPLWLERRADL